MTTETFSPDKTKKIKINQNNLSDTLTNSMENLTMSNNFDMNNNSASNNINVSLEKSDKKDFLDKSSKFNTKYSNSFVSKSN